MADRELTRWQGRRAAATLLEIAVILVPTIVGSLTLWLLAPHLRSLDVVPRLILLLAVSSAAALLAERLTRRLLPLSALLRLTLVFPDRAPSRFRVARQAGNPGVLMARLNSGDLDEATAARTILSLVGSLAAHDRKTRGHSERVRAYTDLLSTELGLPEKDRDRLRWAALLHDIGKLRVDPAILNKPGKPTPQEWVSLRSHPESGFELAGSMLPWLDGWGTAILQHHERYDGLGYPRGLSRSDISLGGRMVAVVDSFETMTAVRSYKKAMSHRVAREELAANAGSQFDPDIVRAFLAVSLPKVLWAMGPLSAALQLPWVHSLQFAGSRVVGLSGGALAAPVLAATVVTAASSPIAAVAATPRHPVTHSVRLLPVVSSTAAATARALPTTTAAGHVAASSPTSAGHVTHVRAPGTGPSHAPRHKPSHAAKAGPQRPASSTVPAPKAQSTTAATREPKAPPTTTSTPAPSKHAAVSTKGTTATKGPVPKLPKVTDPPVPPRSKGKTSVNPPKG